MRWKIQRSQYIQANKVNEDDVSRGPRKLLLLQEINYIRIQGKKHIIYKSYKMISLIINH